MRGEPWSRASKLRLWADFRACLRGFLFAVLIPVWKKRCNRKPCVSATLQTAIMVLYWIDLRSVGRIMMKKLWILIFICLFAACSKAPQESTEQKGPTPEVYKPQVTFADAIKQSDETAVRYYLAQGESPNQLDDDGTPLIVLAAAQDNKEIVNALLAAHVPINAKNTRGEDALWTAVNNGNYDIAELLIILGADVNTKNQDNMTPLMVASQNGYILNVEQLLKNGADLETVRQILGHSDIKQTQQYLHLDTDYIKSVYDRCMK